MKYYLIIVVEDVEPTIKGPFETFIDRDYAAKIHRAQDSDFNDGLYWLDQAENGELSIGTFTGFRLGQEEEG